MTATTLESLETDTKRAFLALLEDYWVHGKEIDQQTFSRLVRFAHFYGIAAGEFSSKFRVTLSTVSRWRTDVAHPIMYIRKEVLAFIQERVRELNMAA